MEFIVATLLGAWSFDFEIVVGFGLTTIVYMLGFREVRVQLPARFPLWRRRAFIAGVALLLLALLSPIDALADLSLQFHMLQHWLLVMVAPPLIWLGAPAVPLMRGLPRRWLVDGLGPFLAWPAVHRGLNFLVRPAVSWSVWAATITFWHLPFAYQAALRAKGWHDFEHATFLLASLLFWFPLIGPWPGKSASGGARILYIGASMVFNTVFSAVFTFSNRLFYPAYAEIPSPWGIAPLVDQNAAGAFFWIAGSVSMSVAAVAVIFSWLEPSLAVVGQIAQSRPARRRPAGLDLLGIPVFGKALRSLRIRRAVQVVMLGLAAAIVLDGWLGVGGESALNLAGVLPWTYWRGLLVIALLLIGNVFCAVCPFTLTRSLAGRLLGNRFEWPAALKSPWVAFAGFLTFLWAYEVFSLWDSPWWTAWIVVGYFASFFLVEGLFPSGTFCRSVCPIGQFQFVGSAVAPFEVAASDPDVCSNCRSHDCLRGNDEAPGCPTGLFMPTKSGSYDCTFCMDCVRACPSGNIGVLASPVRAVGVGQAEDRLRLPSTQIAYTAMALTFSFAAFVNAAAMVGPVVEIEHSLTAWLGTEGRLPAVTLEFLVALVGFPILAAGVCARIGRRLAHLELGVVPLISQLAPCLVPIGFSMWLVHFGFHLVTGIETIGPAFSRVAEDLGLVADARDSIRFTSIGISSEGILGLGIGVLGIGLLWSIFVAWREARAVVGSPRRAAALALPWVGVAVLLYCAGIWILQQPMEMRGMLM
jgi:cytochrome c oxidase assembly factor CtaG/ferredoxin